MRLKVYADASLGVTKKLREFVAEQGMLLEVQAFQAHRFNTTLGIWQLLVSWRGLQDIDDS